MCIFLSQKYLADFLNFIDSTVALSIDKNRLQMRTPSSFMSKLRICVIFLTSSLYLSFHFTARPSSSNRYWYAIVNCVFVCVCVDACVCLCDYRRVKIGRRVSNKTGSTLKFGSIMISEHDKPSERLFYLFETRFIYKPHTEPATYYQNLTNT